MVELDNKAQVMEEIVQKREDFKRISGTSANISVTSIKKSTDQSLIEASLSYKARIKKELARRLRLIERAGKLPPPNRLQECRNEGMTERQYNFIAK